ncbi:acyloxyacyl hydrolase [Vibrio sp. SCSIO 43135]|uniref:acyloxyacyl hydrolase n=1 Tax=Vibrio sp. SCSIO 43135 TaxID=2819096 RepID=UPI0020764696|nr:acyloxyacyl hydrolase [Vibrio sp. SCSIO 43135]USD40572.1 acyloxyacyl hydrolase [Vibrio sp. SCSIO 43135]
MNYLNAIIKSSENELLQRFSHSSLVIFLLIPNSVLAFSGNQNQFSISSGISSRSDGLEELYDINLQYSQPNQFFRLPGRRNIEVSWFVGGEYSTNESEDLSQYNQFIAGASQDVFLFYSQNFYAGAGLGGYIKSKSTHRISSKFTFGQKVFVGLATGRINLELYFRHYSNGTLTYRNAGHNFLGFTFSYNY